MHNGPNDNMIMKQTHVCCSAVRDLRNRNVLGSISVINIHTQFNLFIRI